MNPNTNNMARWQTAVILLFAVLLVFILRSMWTFPIEHSDAVQKYFYAANILRTGDWGILLQNHHTMRWAAMLPQIGLTWLFDTRYEVFFILPLLIFSLYFVPVVFSMRNIINVHLLLVLATLLYVEPLSFGTSNQLLNPPFAIFFAFAGILVLTKDRHQPTLSVVMSAILFFMAYGAHVTYLSLAAGAFAWLAFVQRRFPKAVIFATVIIVLIGMEVAIFNYLSGWKLSLGRLELLAHGHHINQVLNSQPPIHFIQLLTRWLHIPRPDQLLSLIFAIGGPWLIWMRSRGKEIPGIITCVYLVGLSFAIAITFAVLSINPLKPAMGIRPMYLIPFFPFAAVITVYLLSEINIAAQEIIPAWLKHVVASCLAAGFLVWSFSTTGLYRKGYEFFFLNTNVFFAWKADAEYAGFAEKFGRGKLILVGKRRRIHDMIAQFKSPVKVTYRESEISVRNPSPEAKCVYDLDESPIHLNYEDCVQ